MSCKTTREAVQSLVGTAEGDGEYAHIVASFLLAWANRHLYGDFDWSALELLDFDTIWDMNALLSSIVFGSQPNLYAAFENEIQEIARKYRPNIATNIAREGASISTADFDEWRFPFPLSINLP